MWSRISTAVRADMQSSAERWRSTLRATLGFLLVITWGMVTHLDEIYWGMASVAVLSMPTATTTLERAAMRVAGTTVAALVVIAWCAVALDNPPLFFMLMVASMAVAGYLWNASRFSYAMLVFCMTMVLVGYGAVRDPTHSLSTAWVRSSEIAAGVIAVAIATLLIPPERSRDAILRLLASKLRRAGRTMAAVVVVGRRDEATLADLEPSPREQLVALEELVRSAAGEDGEVWRHRDDWLELLWRCERTRLSLDEATRSAAELDATGFPPDTVEAALAATASLQGALDQVAGALESARHVTSPTELPLVDLAGLDAARTVVDESVRRHREAGDYSRLPLDRLSRFFGIVQGIDAAERELRSIVAVMGDFVVGRAARRAAPGAVLHEGANAFTLFPLDRGRLLAGARVGIAVAIAVIVGLVISPGIGGSALVTAAVLSTCPHLGAFAQKAVQRLAAAALGGAIGIALVVWALPNIDSLAGLLLVTAPVCLGISYILAGGPRVNYIGFQAALGFGTGLVAAPHPGTNIEGPFFRVLGVMLGIVICIAVMRSVAPVRAIDAYRSALSRLASAVADLFELLAAGTWEAPASVPRRHALRAQAYSATAGAMEAADSIALTGEWDEGDRRLNRLNGALMELRVSYRQGLTLGALVSDLPATVPTAIRQAVAEAEHAAAVELAALSREWGGEAADGGAWATARREAADRLAKVMESSREDVRQLDLTPDEFQSTVAQLSAVTRYSRHMDRAWDDLKLLGCDDAASALHRK